MFLRILWMHDLSERSDAVLAPLGYLARRLDASVVITHALGAPLRPEEGEQHDPAEDVEVVRRGSEELSEVDVIELHGS